MKNIQEQIQEINDFLQELQNISKKGILNFKRVEENKSNKLKIGIKKILNNSKIGVFLRNNNYLEEQEFNFKDQVKYRTKYSKIPFLQIDNNYYYLQKNGVFKTKEDLLFNNEEKNKINPETQKKIYQSFVNIISDILNCHLCFNKALCLEQEQKYEQAIKEFNKVIAIEPKTLFYRARGEAHFKSQNYEKAIEDYTKVIKLDSELALVYLNRGTNYLTLGNDTEAIKNFEKASKLNFKVAEDLKLKCRMASIDSDTSCYFSQAFMELIKNLKKIIRPNRKIEFNFEFTKDLEPEHKTAFRVNFKFAKDLESEHKTAYTDCGTDYSSSPDCIKAIQDFKKAIESNLKLAEDSNPKLVEIYSNRGVACLFLRDHVKAIKDFKKAIESNLKLAEDSNPKLVKIYSTRGIYWLSLQNYKQAIDNFKKAIESSFKLAEDLKAIILPITYKNYGFAYFQLGKYIEAIKNFEKAIELNSKFAEDLNPKLAEAYNECGFNYFLSSKNCAEAIKDLKEAINLDSKESKFLNNLALIYDLLGNQAKDKDECVNYFNKAIDYFTKASKLSNQDSILFANLACAYAKVGDKEKADKNLKLAEELRAKNEFISTRYLSPSYTKYLEETNPSLLEQYRANGNIFEDTTVKKATFTEKEERRQQNQNNERQIL